jgi:hypothetical protein
MRRNRCAKFRGSDHLQLALHEGKMFLFRVRAAKHERLPYDDEPST